MAKHSFVLSMKPAGFDSTDDHWRIVMDQHLKIWVTATTLLRSWKIEHDARKIQIEIDWNPAVESCQQYKSAKEELQEFLDRNAPPSMKALRKFPGQTKIKIEVQATKGKTQNRYFHPTLYVQNRLADIFLMMNIAQPGCCDFYLAKFSGRRADTSELQTDEISLSNILFEISRVTTLDGRWPGASAIALETVVKWFETIRSGVRQLPQNQFEKVIFSVLQLAHSDSSPTSIVWIFYALETLLDTKPGENRAALERRLIMLLEPGEKQKSELKTKLRELYEYRSSVVHGGLSAASPLHLELLDEDFDDEYRRMLDLVQYGFALLLGCLQKVAAEGWTELRFRDVMEVR